MMKRHVRKIQKNQIRKRWLAGTFSLMLVFFMLLTMAQPALVDASVWAETEQYDTEVVWEDEYEQSEEEVANAASEDVQTAEDVTDTEEVEEETAERTVIEPSEEATAALDTTDLSGMRLIIGTSDASILADEQAVIANYDEVYLLQYESLEDTETAFLSYYDQVDFITADVAVSVAEDETDEDPAEEIITTDNVYTEEANPFAELATALEAEIAQPEETVRRIALIDTGAALSDNVIDAVSMIGEDGSDENGHGEHMVNFITEQDPDAEIISIKALGADGKGDVSAVIAGITYAMENNASIINLSVSAYASEENAALADAIRRATEAGITVVGAAGNNGFNAKYYTPANIAEAMIIGACDESGARIAKSNFGETVDYNVVAEATSEAAAKFSGFLSANGAEAIADVLNGGLIFETAYEGEGDVAPAGDGAFIAASAYGGKDDQGDAQQSVKDWLTDRGNTGSGKYFLDPDDGKSVVVKT